MVSDEKILEAEHELLEASAEMRTLMEGRKAEVEGLGVSDTARVVVSERRCRCRLAGVSVRSSQKKRKAVARKESAGTQEYESCHQNDMDLDMDENKEELRFVPSTVSRSAGWHEPKFRCDEQCRKEGFKFHDIASVMVEDDGEPPTRNLCLICHNMRQDERMKPGIRGGQWKILVGG